LSKFLHQEVNMTIEEQIAALNKKIDDYHAEDVKRANRDRYERISYVSWGFALASTGLSIANMRINTFATMVSVIMAIGFVIIGVGLYVYSRRYN